MSDSELSTETNSLSAESNAAGDSGRSPVAQTPSGHSHGSQTATATTTTTAAAASSAKGGAKPRRRRGAEWEIIDSATTVVYLDRAPTRLEGFLLKKRKWPLKGWHKVRLLLFGRVFIFQWGDTKVYVSFWPTSTFALVRFFTFKLVFFGFDEGTFVCSFLLLSLLPDASFFPNEYFFGFVHIRCQRNTARSHKSRESI